VRLASRFDKEKNPLPEGTLSVGAGLIVSGVTAYGFLAISARALGPSRYAPLGVLWALMFVAGPGFFLPLEQEVGRALAERRARGLGGGPLIRRATLAGGAVAIALVVATAASGNLVLDELFDGRVLLLAGFMFGLAGYFAEHLLRGTLSGNGRFGTYGVVIGSEAVLRLAACAALAVVGVKTAGPYGLALGLAPFAATAIGIRREGRSLVTPGPDAPWAELTAALGYLLAASVLAQLLVNSGVLAVQLLASEGESEVAGRFLNGLIIARVPLFMFQAVQASLLPALAAHAGAGRQEDFRAGLKRLLVVVVAIGVVATITAWAIGAQVVELLFGAGFELSRTDLAYLAGASAAYMLALALAQALIALSAYARVVAGWGAGIAVFVVVTASQSGLLPRVERGFLAGACASATVMGVLLATRMAGGIVSSASKLSEAAFEVPIEP
jgi:O-antigen/teichoic acid export membrane protein